MISPYHARGAGAKMVLDSDAQEPGDLLTRELALMVVRGAGLGDEDARRLLGDGPKVMTTRVGVGEGQLSD